MKTYAMCLVAALLANGCTTIDETTPPVVMDELTVTVNTPDDVVTDITADIVVTISKPIAGYTINVIGPVYDLPTGESITGQFPDGTPFLPTFVLPETGLQPDTGYLVVVYVSDKDGNVSSAHTSFRTKPATTTNPELKISNINMMENYGGTNTRAISFNLNEQAFWEVQVYDSSISSGYYAIDGGEGTGAVAALYLTTGHDYILRILAYTQGGDSTLEEFSVGTW